ncbi:type 4a pilus biogenesis protein PilO [candidate division WOR-3 bacterium]|nr:type 4a pilus biogenesis protein PilO [candidate division WOR-3 bacterium]
MDRSLIRNIIIAVVIVVGIGFLYWKFDYSKNAGKISTLNTEYNKLNTQVAEARRVAARMQETIEKLKTLEATLKIANKMLPDSQNFELIIDTITILSERNGIKIKKMTPLPVSIGAESSSRSFNISIFGSYNTLAMYLTALGNQTRIYKIRDLKIKPIKSDEGDFSIQSQLTITTFFQGTGIKTTKKGGEK